ncbi:hypothetical protein EYC80_007622 [Monilinia laxa]|uniref:Uncharacterized protein n=1 Tax=Monilinia laxa TaxID=61186 RepID=A0A5N6JWH5_MONLA|nr:hypothetical protein EYC80_007622 [Monilinia laxa]
MEFLYFFCHFFVGVRSARTRQVEVGERMECKRGGVISFPVLRAERKRKWIYTSACMIRDENSLREICFQSRFQRYQIGLDQCSQSISEGAQGKSLTWGRGHRAEESPDAEANLKKIKLISYDIHILS